jgi:alcohol dehydrogenase, propanol-preferring
MGVMLAWVVDRPGPVAEHPLRRIERARPEPAAGQVLVRIRCCGVCRTDLHLAEGDLPPVAPSTVPGHEIVGSVEALGDGAARFAVGDRVGVAWLGRTDGTCRFCRSGRENLCESPTFTGWHVDGGYADFCVVEERFAYALPASMQDEKAAPLLCAGIIGYRAFRAADLPSGGSLGIYGFGGSGHLTAQLALRMGHRVHVLTRGEGNRRLAVELGADSVAGADGLPPEPLDGAILFAPAGELVPNALRALDSGGTLAVAGIWLSDIPGLNYESELFRERKLRSVTANTRNDGEEFLALAARLGVEPTTVPYDMADADRALADLAGGRFSGAAVLHN